MNNYATNGRERRFWIWMIWFVVITSALTGGPAELMPMTAPLLGIVVLDESSRRALFPWQNSWYCKKWAYLKYKSYQRKYLKAKRVVQVARLYLRGLLTMVQVVEHLTASQVRYKLGALPVLYSLLETLEVREIINRHCKTKAEVDYGAVVVVLALNRLMCPLPLSKVADRVGETVLVAVLEVPKNKFNDDRLGRTLDAIHEKLGPIWFDIVDVAIRKAEIDLSVIFYDISAFIGHGNYKESEMMDFGFAHNTPSDKRKLKLGLNVSADGNIPWYHRLWSGRTADQSTVENNLENLSNWLTKHGYPVRSTLVIGDRAMLNGEIAILYDEKGLRHLTGYRALTNEAKDKLSRWSDDHFQQAPIVDGPSPQYWGKGDEMTFTHGEKSVTHKALVVLAGPIRDQIQQARLDNIEALEAELAELNARIGQPRFRTIKGIRRTVNARVKASTAKKFLIVKLQEEPDGRVTLHWQRDTLALFKAERLDGRYLLVTNDYSLSHKEMFRLYRQKDGVETCFHICKDDLKLSPLYLHKDKRIASMIFVNMIALLAYNLLQRQVQQRGLQLTTRKLIEKFEQLIVIETLCHDGSRLQRLAEVDSDILAILHFVKIALDNMVHHIPELVDSQPLLDSVQSDYHIPILC